MFSIQEQERNFHSFSHSKDHSWHTQLRPIFFFQGEWNSFPCQGGVLSFAPCQKWMQNIFHLKISLSAHCYLHVNVAFHFSKWTAIPICLQGKLFLWQKKGACRYGDKTGCHVAYIKWFRAFHPGPAESYLSQKVCSLFSSNGNSAKSNMHGDYSSSGNKLF